MLKVVLTTFDNFYTINKQKLLSQLKSKFTKACKFTLELGQQQVREGLKKQYIYPHFFSKGGGESANVDKRERGGGMWVIF